MIVPQEDISSMADPGNIWLVLCSLSKRIFKAIWETSNPYQHQRIYTRMCECINIPCKNTGNILSWLKPTKEYYKLVKRVNHNQRVKHHSRQFLKFIYLLSNILFFKVSSLSITMTQVKKFCLDQLITWYKLAYFTSSTAL